MSLDQEPTSLEWYHADPGVCTRCGTKHEWVRPGKTQPTCDCDNFCYLHNEPVKIEYRSEIDSPSDKGGIFGYVCPVCWPENDSKKLD